MLLARYTQKSSTLLLPARIKSKKLIRSLLSSSLPPLHNPKYDINSQEIAELFKDIDKPDVHLMRGSVEYEREKLSAAFPNITDIDFDSIFDEKIQMCMSKSVLNDEEEKLKMNALEDLISLIHNDKMKLNLRKNHYVKLLEVAEANLFRSIPMNSNAFLNFDEQLTDPDPHFNQHDMAFQILLFFFTENKMKELLPFNYHKKILYLLNSPDSRERDIIVQCFVHYYVLFPERRDFVILHICLEVDNYIAGVSSPFCVWPVLNILCRVFNASTSKIPIEWQKMIGLHILPLLKTPHLPWFSRFLRTIFSHLMSLNQNNSTVILNYLLNHWPKASQTKQPIFLQFLSDTLENLPDAAFCVNVQKIFKIYTECATTDSSKVCEESFKIWQNPKIVHKIKKKINYILAQLRLPLEKVSKTHWATKTKDEAISTLKIMQMVDKNAYDMASVGQHSSHIREKLQNKWILVAKSAVMNDHQFNIREVVDAISEAFSYMCSKTVHSEPIKNKGQMKKMAKNTQRRSSLVWK